MNGRTGGWLSLLKCEKLIYRYKSLYSIKRREDPSELYSSSKIIIFVYGRFWLGRLRKKEHP